MLQDMSRVIARHRQRLFTGRLSVRPGDAEMAG
jgi:hypothetical protein